MQAARQRAAQSVLRLLGSLPGDPALAETCLARGLHALQSAARTSAPVRVPACQAAAHALPWRPGASMVHRQALLRQFSSAAEDEAATAAVHDTLRPRVLRFFALLMIAGAGANVLPHMAAASVGHCLSLLDATQPFMIKAGCSRLRLLMRLDAARARAVAAGAAAKLLRVVQAPDADAGVVDYALAALEDLCACQEGLESLREAGGAAGLQAFLAGAGGGAAAEDAAQRARRLLAALDRLGDLPAF